MATGEQQDESVTQSSVITGSQARLICPVCNIVVDVPAEQKSVRKCNQGPTPEKGDGSFWGNSICDQRLLCRPTSSGERVAQSLRHSNSAVVEFGGDEKQQTSWEAEVCVTLSALEILQGRPLWSSTAFVAVSE